MNSLMTLLLAVFTACTGPWEPDIAYDPNLTVPYQEDVLYLTAANIADEYDDITPYDLDANVQPRWAVTFCPDTDRYAVLNHGQCYKGFTFDCELMYVALSDRREDRTCGSALAHEFGHCARIQLGWSGDMFHEDTRFWDVIAETGRQSCDMGW